MHECVCVSHSELECCVGRSILCWCKLISGIQTLGALCSCVLLHPFMKGGKMVYAVAVCVRVRECVCECARGNREKDREEKTTLILEIGCLCFHIEQKVTTVALPSWCDFSPDVTNNL